MSLLRLMLPSFSCCHAMKLIIIVRTVQASVVLASDVCSGLHCAARDGLFPGNVNV